jgi:hypothetical protein
VDTEMCCPKGQCGCQYFILLTLEENKIRGHRDPGFFDKKLIVKEIYVIFIHLFDSGILLIIDLNKKKRGKEGGFYL